MPVDTRGVQIAKITVIGEAPTDRRNPDRISFKLSFTSRLKKLNSRLRFFPPMREEQCRHTKRAQGKCGRFGDRGEQETVGGARQSDTLSDYLAIIVDSRSVKER